MTAPEFRAALIRLGWSQARAARILRTPERTVRAWADPGPRHRVPHPLAVLVLDMAESVPGVRVWLESGER